jgi:WD40 repeat protein
VVSSYLRPDAVVFDVRTGQQVLTLEGHLHGLLDVAWSPDGTSIATASFDASARIFDASTGRELFVVVGHGSHVTALDWAADSRHLVTASADGTAKVWLIGGRAGGARNLVTVSGQDTRRGTGGVAFSPDGTRVMIGDTSVSSTTIWDVTPAGTAEVANLPTLAFFYPDAAFTPDGDHLLATGPGASITVWDAGSFTRVRAIGGSALSDVGPLDTLLPSSDAEVTGLTMNRDGGLVAGVSERGHVRVWDTHTGEEAFAVGPPSWPDGVAWSADGQLLATAEAGDHNGRVTIRDTSGREVTVLEEEPGARVGSVAFSADGEWLITTRFGPGTSVTPQVVTWDWRSGEIEQTIDADAAAAVPSTTGLIATLRDERTADGQVVDVWDLETGRRVSTLVGHSGDVNDLVFSADGSRLATASSDGTARVWDPRTGEQQLVLRGGHLGSLITSVDFSPDSRRLATAAADGVVRIWALELDDLVEIAEGGLTRPFTDQECQRYLHTERCP